MKNKSLIPALFVLSLGAISLFFAGCKTDLCKSVTCKNGGTKSASGKTCKCKCPTGYEGEFCETKSCTTNGTTVNIGSTSGGTYSTDVATFQANFPGTTTANSGCNYYCSGYTDIVKFDNTNLNFSAQTTNSCCTNNCFIMDVGVQTCLNFTYSGTPSALIVAYAQSHGYVANFSDGHIVKFIANSYYNGSVNISYIFQ